MTSTDSLHHGASGEQPASTASGRSTRVPTWLAIIAVMSAAACWRALNSPLLPAFVGASAFVSAALVYTSTHANPSLARRLHIVTGVTVLVLLAVLVLLRIAIP
jgi:hypothetical protein